MPPPRKRPQRRGAYAAPGSVRPELSASAYHWPCPCGCTRNLRGLLREVCTHCTHVHPNPAATPQEPTP